MTPRTITVVCDHAGTPKRNRRERRLAEVTYSGQVDGSTPYLDVEYFGRDEPDVPTRLAYSLEQITADPTVLHLTYRFRCRPCGWDLPIEAQNLADAVVAYDGVASLSLFQLAATVRDQSGRRLPGGHEPHSP